MSKNVLNGYRVLETLQVRADTKMNECPVLYTNFQSSGRKTDRQTGKQVNYHITW